jgi:hypothetical protein
MSKQPESLFKEKVLAQLARIERVWACKVQQVVTRGTPDILVCWGGRFVALELKTDKGRLDKLQAANLELINRSGGLGMVVKPSDWDEKFEQAKDWASHPEKVYELAVKHNRKDVLRELLLAQQENERLRRALLWASYNVSDAAKSSIWFKELCVNMK